eukprot:TRINITY_DN1889_c0_g1_i4.p1 TRINITY_DN1889_c0_g1~~TRINITY_DN1889_c0_g1_i4.p1  ORF type:complete len:339 (+),score=98.40 TRINITY_DN1889_c0_g1_i4:102-1118(+)
MIHDFYNMKNINAPQADGEAGYPDKITVEEHDEDEVAAFPLFTEIKDPYYARKESSEYTEEVGTGNEEVKLGMDLYKNFCAYPKKSESFSNFLQPDVGSIKTKFQDHVPNENPPYLKLRQRVNQEPKRYPSAGIMPKNDGLHDPAAFHEHQPQYLSYHRTGVSTPPPGLSYHENAFQTSYSFPYSLYGPSAIPQHLAQNDVAGSYPFPEYSHRGGYYSVYVSYQGYPQETGYYTPPVQPVSISPTNKNAPLLKPSKFRPNKSLFAKREKKYADSGEEERIAGIIEEFQKENDEEALRERIAELAVTQTGSRFLQHHLNKARPSFVSFVLQEVTCGLSV